MKHITRFITLGILLVLATGCSNEDPVVNATGQSPIQDTFSIAYLKRPATTFYKTSPFDAFINPAELNDPNTPTVGLTSGNVYTFDLSNPDAKPVNITSQYTAPILGAAGKSAGDVSGLNVSYDGRYLVFAMHPGVLVDAAAAPNHWHIWSYDTQAPAGVDPLKDLTDASTNAKLTSNDSEFIDPAFLPDGRIVFSSNLRLGSRAKNGSWYGDQYITINERSGLNSGNEAFALHVMNADGSDIHQITFNQSNDLKPAVLDHALSSSVPYAGKYNGKIIFTRWDGTPPVNDLNLYTVNPDGSDLELLYGARSHNQHTVTNPTTNTSTTYTMQFTDARMLPDGNLLGMYLPNTGDTRGGGQMIQIDINNFIEQSTKRFTSQSASNSGQWLVKSAVSPVPGISKAGRYTTPFPLYEPGSTDRVLVSLDPCRVTLDLNNPIAELCTSSNLGDPAYQLANPLYNIWIYSLDTNDSRTLVRGEPGYALVNPVALLNRPLASRPSVILDKSTDNGNVDPDLYTNNMGVINIKSVYDTEGTTAMVDRPLQPNGATPLLTSEVAAIPTRTVQLDKRTGKLITTADPNAVPVDRTVADIATIRNPTTAAFQQRVARFIRISKAVPRFNSADYPGSGNLTNNDFGRYNTHGMREILGYAVVEPDGSAYFQVPAGVPITLNVLDAKGRSLMPHRNWLQLQPGEVRVCNGCHEPRDGQGNINPGAPDNIAFPGTNGALVPNQRETMAETRTRLDTTYATLKHDMQYDDVWSVTPEASIYFQYSGADGLTGGEIPPYSTAGCAATWTDTCRIAVDFPDHVQKIFDEKCISCHNAGAKLDGSADAQALNGNLVLTDTSPVPNNLLDLYYQNRLNTSRSPSYEFLFSARPQLELNPDQPGMYRFVVQRIDAPDPMDPMTIRSYPMAADGTAITDIANESNITVDDLNRLQLITRPALVSAGLSRSRNSRLIEKLSGETLHPNTPVTVGDPHASNDPTTGYRTSGELRVIIEWIDSGTHYYNNLEHALATNP